MYRAVVLRAALGFLLCSGLGCSSSVDPAALNGLPCPCVDGFTCLEAQQVCVPDGTEPLDDDGSETPPTNPSTNPSNNPSNNPPNNPPPPVGNPPSSSPIVTGTGDAGMPFTGMIPLFDASTAELCGDVRVRPNAKCPDLCDSCDGDICHIACRGNACANRWVQCPPNFACLVSCQGADCSRTTDDCPTQQPCQLECGEGGSCAGANFLCGKSPCKLACDETPGGCADATVQCGRGACLADCPADAGVRFSACGESCATDCACAF